MGTTRENKYRSYEYKEGKYLICRMSSGRWSIHEMSEFEGEPLEYDAQCLSEVDQYFDTLRDARVWCGANQ